MKKLLLVLMLLCVSESLSQVAGAKDSTIKVQKFTPARATNRNIVLDGNLKPDSLGVGMSTLPPGVFADTVRNVADSLRMTRDSTGVLRTAINRWGVDTTVALRESIEGLQSQLTLQSYPEVTLLETYRSTLELAIMPHWAKTLGVTGGLGGTSAYYTASNIGDTITTISDFSKNANRFTVQATNVKWGTTDGAYCLPFADESGYLQGRLFENPGFANFASGNFSLMMYLDPDENGENDTYFSTRPTGAGFTLRKLADDSVQVYAEMGGLEVMNETAGGVLKADSAGTWVVVRVNSDSGFVRVGNQAWQSFPITARTFATSASTRLCENYTGKLGAVFLFSTYISDSTIAQFKAIDQTTASFLSPAITQGYSTFTLDKITGLEEWVDFTDSTYLSNATDWSDTVAHGEQIGSYKSKVANSTFYKSGLARGTGATWDRTNGANFGTSNITYDFYKETLISMTGADFTFAIVMTADTAGGVLISDGSTRKLSITTTNSGQNDYFNHINYLISGLNVLSYHDLGLFGVNIPREQRFIFVFRKEGQTYSVTVNGEYFASFSTGDAKQITYWYTMLGFPSQNFKGYVREYAIWNAALSNAQLNMVISKLGTRHSVSVQSLNTSEDGNRVTVRQLKRDTEHLYCSFPFAKIRNNEIHAMWEEQDSHNGNPDINDRYAFATISKAGAILTIDTLSGGPDSTLSLNRNYNGFDFLNTYNNDKLYAITEADWNNRDTVRGAWQTNIGNTWGTVTVLTHPQYAKFAPMQAIVEGSKWYILSYATGVSGHYALSMMKSTNSGSSWDTVWNFKGVDWGNRDPEEPYLIKLSSGKYFMTIRDDVYSQIWWDTTSSLDTRWAVSPKLIGYGIARPEAVEMDDGRVLVVTGAVYPLGQSVRDNRKGIYYVSNSSALSAWNSHWLDEYREFGFGYDHAYGAPMNFGGGSVGVLYGGESASTVVPVSGGNGKYADISLRILSP